MFKTIYNTDYAKNNKDKGFVFFWGNQKSEDGKVTKSCLSQWYESPFIGGETYFLTAEHFMMYKKAELFNDRVIMKKVLETETQREVKALGRQVKNFDSKIWDSEKFNLVVEGNLFKFVQNKELHKFLQSTGDKILVEASPYDKIWGIGLRVSDFESRNPELWQGENLLGFALMEVREITKNLNL